MNVLDIVFELTTLEQFLGNGVPDVWQLSVREIDFFQRLY